LTHLPAIKLLDTFAVSSATFSPFGIRNVNVIEKLSCTFAARDIPQSVFNMFGHYQYSYVELIGWFWEEGRFIGAIKGVC
jgi:hypothetical protein